VLPHVSINLSRVTLNNVGHPSPPEQSHVPFGFETSELRRTDNRGGVVLVNIAHEMNCESIKTYDRLWDVKRVRFVSLRACFCHILLVFLLILEITCFAFGGTDRTGSTCGLCSRSARRNFRDEGYSGYRRF